MELTSEIGLGYFSLFEIEQSEFSNEEFFFQMVLCSSSRKEIFEIYMIQNRFKFALLKHPSLSLIINHEFIVSNLAWVIFTNNSLKININNSIKANILQTLICLIKKFLDPQPSKALRPIDIFTVIPIMFGAKISVESIQGEGDKQGLPFFIYNEWHDLILLKGIERALFVRKGGSWPITLQLKQKNSIKLVKPTIKISLLVFIYPSA